MVTSESTRTSHIPNSFWQTFLVSRQGCQNRHADKPHERGHIFPPDQSPAETPIQIRNDVTSHRNVTAIVDLKPELNPVANIRRPRFSFSLCNCQKTDEKIRRNQSTKSPKRSRLKPQTRTKLSLETSERVRRSPAAPPPSLVSGL